MQRIVHLVVQVKRWCGCRGGEKNVRFGESLVHLPSDHGPDPLGLAIVGVVVARGKSEGTQHDPPLDLRAESPAPGFAIHLYKPVGLHRPYPVPDSVVTSEVRGGFSRRDDIVCGHSVLCTWKGDRDQLRASGLEGSPSLAYQLLHFRFYTLPEILLRQPDGDTLHLSRENGRVIGNRNIGRGAVGRVVAGDGLEQDGAVCDISGQGPHLVQGGGKSDNTVTADPAVGGFHTNHTAVGGRLADGPTSVGTEGTDGLARGNGGC